MNRWPLVSIVAGAAALIIALHVLPSGVQALLLAAVVLLGPGAALRSWVAPPAPIATLAMLATGVTLVTVYVAIASVWFTIQPAPSLIVLGLLLIVVGSARIVRDRRMAAPRDLPTPAGGLS